jgi:hypothetical protein
MRQLEVCLFLQQLVRCSTWRVAMRAEELNIENIGV